MFREVAGVFEDILTHSNIRHVKSLLITIVVGDRSGQGFKPISPWSCPTSALIGSLTKELDLAPWKADMLSCVRR